MSIIEKALGSIRKKQGVSAESSRQSIGATENAPAEVSAAEAPHPSGLYLNPVKSVVVDHGALRREGLLPVVAEERRFNEQFRHIKRPLIANARERSSPRARVLMVGGAQRNEGKTFAALNLANSIAREADVTVLLVDADTPKGHLTQAFGLDGAPGLVELLREPNISVNDCAVSTDVRGLCFLPSGAHFAEATELLGSARMSELLAELCAADPNLFIVIDSPPLLQTTESQYIAQAAGELILVVKYGSTPVKDVQDALALLDESTPVSLMLNQSPDAAVGSYYYGRVTD